VTRARFLLPVLALALVLTRVGVSTQSLSYSSGQDISPAYEGFEKNADGSFNLVFGFMNRNWEEEIDVPTGPDNNISPGPADQGQPTHFLPRRNRFMFRVRVPADFGDKELVWTLTTHGRTNKAYASLRADYIIDDVVIASETGALGAGSSSPEMRANKPPVVKIEGPKTRTAKVGQPLQLVALVTDDGVPKRRPGGGGGGGNAAAAIAAAGAAGGRGAGAAGGRGGAGRGAGRGAADAGGAAPAPGAAAAPAVDPAVAAAIAAANAAGPATLVPGLSRAAFNPPSRITVGKVLGLHQMWFVYRGAGKVTFDPPQTEVWEDTRAGANSPWAPLWQPPPAPADGRWISTVTFDDPGTYVLVARADDGSVTGDDQLTVTVTK
jgi:hypothetical protein